MKGGKAASEVIQGSDEDVRNPAYIQAVRAAYSSLPCKPLR